MKRTHILLAASLVCMPLGKVFAKADVSNFIYSDGSDGATLDPHTYTDVFSGRHNISNVYEALTWLNDEGYWEGYLLKEIKSLSPTQWLLVVRDDVTFSDNTPMTIDDVEFSINRVRNSNVRKGSWSDVEDIEVISDNSIMLTTKKPDALLPQLLSSVLVMNKAWAEKNGAVKTANMTDSKTRPYTYDHAFGTGPYILQKRIQDEMTEYVPNPNYWNTGKVGTQRGNLKKLTYMPIGEPKTRLQALQSGQIHWTGTVPVKDADRLKALDGIKVNYIDWGSYSHFHVNFKNKHLTGQPDKPNAMRDRRVRQAIQYALDNQAISDRIYNGYYRPSTMPVMEGMTGWDDSLKVYNENAYNPEKAKALLKEAGQEDLKITMVCNNAPFTERTCLYAAAALKKVGIKVDLKFEAFQQTLKRIYDDSEQTEWDLMAMGYGASDESYWQLRNYACDAPWSSKYVGYCNPEMDVLINQGRTNLNETERRAALVKAMKLWAEDLPRIEMVARGRFEAMSDNIYWPARFNNQYKFSQLSAETD